MQTPYFFTCILLFIIAQPISALPTRRQPILHFNPTTLSHSTQQCTPTIPNTNAPTPLHPTTQSSSQNHLHKRQTTALPTDWSTTVTWAPTTSESSILTSTWEWPTGGTITVPTSDPPTQPTRPPSSSKDPRTSGDGPGGPVTTEPIGIPTISGSSGSVTGGATSRGATVGGTGSGGLTVPTSRPGSPPNDPKGNGSASGPGSESGSPSSSSGSSSIGAIIGGIVAAAVIVAATAGFLFYKSRRSSHGNAQSTLDYEERDQGARGDIGELPPLMDDGKIEDTLSAEKDTSAGGSRSESTTTGEVLGGPTTRVRGPQALHTDTNDLSINTPLHEFENQRNNWSIPPAGSGPRSPQDTTQQDYLSRLMRVQQDQMEKLKDLVVQHRRSLVPQPPHASDLDVEPDRSSGVEFGSSVEANNQHHNDTNKDAVNGMAHDVSNVLDDLDLSGLSGLQPSNLDDTDNDGYSITTTRADGSNNAVSQSNSNNLVEFVTPGAANTTTAIATLSKDMDNTTNIIAVPTSTDPFPAFAVEETQLPTPATAISEEKAALIKAIAAMKAQYDEQYRLIHEDLTSTSRNS